MSSVANEYSGYVATPEEYALQYYEGGHTLYGPKTLPFLAGHAARLAAELADPAAHRMPRAGRGLRSSQLRLLSLTPAEGLRLTDLAQRVGMTKQALGEFADVLEARGLLETVRDPSDRRVRILRPTRTGSAVVVAGGSAIAAVEARWRERLCRRRWDQLRTLLAEAADHDAKALRVMGRRLLEVLDPEAAEAEEARRLEREEAEARAKASATAAPPR